MQHKRLTALLLTLLILPLVGFIAMRLFSQLAPAPDSLGLRDGRLAPCPDGSINCVGSQSTGDYAAIAPLTFSGDRAAARERLLTLMAGWPRTELVTADDTYLHYVVRSQLFAFPDDLEFQIGDGVIDVRSAARLGMSDLGVNRARLEEIRTAWESGAGG